MVEDLSRCSRLATSSDDELAADLEVRAEEALTIAQAAKIFGTTPRALRFYEGKGLLSPRRQGAIRFYDRSEQERLALVLKAKALGFTLAETRRMLAPPGEAVALNVSRRECFEQIRLLEQRKREIELALTELRRTYSSFYVRIAANND